MALGWVVTTPSPYERSQRAGLDHLLLIAVEQAEGRRGRPAPTLPFPRAAVPRDGDQVALLYAEVAAAGLPPHIPLPGFPRSGFLENEV